MSTRFVAVMQIRLCWQRRLEGRTLPRFKVLSVEPEPAYPLGRKGLLLASAWQQLVTPECDGLLLYDGDVVIDPRDHDEMVTAASSDPAAVWTAPARLWPAATGLPGWVWGHRKFLPEGTPPEVQVAAGQRDIDDPDMFTFCFTYLPRALVEGAVKAGLEEWMYPRVDEGMWRTAREMGIRVRVVRYDCHPRHLNW